MLLILVITRRTIKMAFVNILNGLSNLFAMNSSSSLETLTHSRREKVYWEHLHTINLYLKGNNMYLVRDWRVMK